MRWFVPLIACLAAPARADSLPPITDNNYSIELYDGVALGNGVLVGMGGAGTANAQGTSGTLINPSAPAVRSTTDTDSWSWDYHIDYLFGSLSSDYDNNDIERDNGTSAITAGLGIRYHDYAGAFTFTDQFATFLGDPDPMMMDFQPHLRVSTVRVQLALAAWLARRDIALGASVQSALFELRNADTQQTVFQLNGAGLEAGVTWIPRYRSLRVGVATATPVIGGKEDIVDPAACMGTAPRTCAGFITPNQVVSAWRVRGGFAYRWAGSEWNQLVGGWFRDEPSLTLTTDLIFAGPVLNAYGLEAFTQKKLQRSGRDISVGVRVGAEYEWLPGRLRVRAGSYLEPGRFVGVGPRLHGTFGIDVRVFQFWFWGTRRRGRLGLTADVATHYRNIGASIGFWH